MILFIVHVNCNNCPLSSVAVYINARVAYYVYLATDLELMSSLNYIHTFIPFYILLLSVYNAHLIFTISGCCSGTLFFH